MIKRIVKTVSLAVISFVVCYLIAWITASQGLFGDVEFGYYAEFNVAKHAIEASGCAEKIEYSGVNKDLFLEEFHFKVTTRSGRVVRLWFDASNMDVRNLCYKPLGFSISHSGPKPAQVYTVGGLAELLRGTDIQVRDLRGVLCNIAQLEKLLNTNHGNANVLLESNPYIRDFLRIEFPTEEELMRGRKYADVREKDVTE
jgi:hypothetical protein